MPGTTPDSGQMDATMTTMDAGPPIIIGLSEHAQIGLAQTPVPLNLAGKTAAEIEQIGQGAYIVSTQAICTDCHSPSPNPAQYLQGGVVIPLGPDGDGGLFTVVSRNLTPEPSTGLKDTLGQFIQAERNGTDTLNSAEELIVHPWQNHRWMSTADLTAVYSFLRVIPQITNTYALDNKPPLPPVSFPNVYNEGQVTRPLPPEVDAFDAAVPDPGFVLRGTAIDPLNVTPPPDPTQAALFGRGSYLVNGVIGCSACHSNPDRNAFQPPYNVNTPTFLSGGTVIAAGPLASTVRVVRVTTANLIGQSHGFFNEPGMTFSTFLTTITQGIHADEENEAGVAPPLAWPMPWTEFRHMGLDDLEAIYTYLSWIAKSPAAPTANDVVHQGAARYCASAATDCFPGESCNAATSECYGGPCNTDSDCGTCQTCSSDDGGASPGTCVPPAPTSLCVLTALQL